MAENIEVGAILDGKVIKFKPFGAIMSLPDNQNGLVHISHISNNYVQNINEYLEVGDVVKVKVISIDPATNKISLSIKEAYKDLGEEYGFELPKKKITPTQTVSHFDIETPPRRPPVDINSTFEEKFKDWARSSNDKIAGINKRNKRR